MKRTIVAVLATLAAACGGSQCSSPLTAVEARAALPSAAQAKIAVPGGATASAGSASALSMPGASTDAVQAATAPYAEATIALAWR